MVYIVKLSSGEPVSDVGSSRENFSTTENHIETSSSQNSFSECGKLLAEKSSQDIFPVAGQNFYNTITYHSKFSSDNGPLCEKNSSQNSSFENRIPWSKTSSSSQDFSSDDDESLPQPSFSQNKVRASKKPFVCDICQKRFNFKRNFDCHRHSHVRVKKQFCKLCRRTFLHKMAYNNHFCIKNAKKNAEKNKSFVCNICGQEFEKEHLFLCHIEIHNETSDTPLVCEKCKKEFTDRSSLNRHMDTHIPVASKSFECNICHDKFPSSYFMKKHITDKHTIFFKCETCDRKFPDRIKLNSHIKNIHTTCDTTFVCDICEKSFLNKRSLAEHVKLALHPKNTKKSAEKDKSFVCNICGRKFVKEHLFLDHLQIHNEKSDTLHFCKKCKKEFTDKPSLMHHMDTHIPVRSKSFECNICHDKLPSLYFMKKHITDKHTIFFKCETCDRRFQDSIRLSSHKQNVHTICGICEKRFLTKRDLGEHINSHRNDQI